MDIVTTCLPSCPSIDKIGALISGFDEELDDEEREEEEDREVDELK